MAAILGSAMKAFIAAQERGQLPAAAPYIDVRTESHGLAASGVDTACVADLAFSSDVRERAAAAVIACTNVARAAEQQNSALHFAQFERKQVVRILSTLVHFAWVTDSSTDGDRPHSIFLRSPRGAP